MKIRTILAASFMIITVLPIAALGIWFDRSAFEKEVDAVREKHLLLAGNLSATLARAAYRYPAIRRPMVMKEYVFVHDDGRTRKLTATNKLLKRQAWITGMKTGTTNASGKCLVASGEKNGRAAISVILGSTNAAIDQIGQVTRRTTA